MCDDNQAFAPDADQSGPAAHTCGELALQADLQLAEMITENVFILDAQESAAVLNVLRLVYWQSWYERTGMWLNRAERDSFAQTLAHADRSSPALSLALLEETRRIAAEDAGDTCGRARNSY